MTIRPTAPARYLVEPCVCGGWLAAEDDESSILAAVTGHNATPEHRAWRTRRRRVETTREWRLRLRAEVELTRLQRWAEREAA